MLPNSSKIKKNGSFSTAFNSSDKDLTESFSSEGEKKQYSENDAAPQIQTKYKIESRSLKKKKVLYQISFQQNFLHEHQSSLRKSLRNYIESSIGINRQTALNQKCFSFLKPSVTIKEENDEKKLILTENHLLSKKNKIQFSKDLQNEEKLSQFLLSFPYQMSEALSAELIFLASLIWEKYIQIRNPLLNQKQIKEYSKKYAQQNAQQLFSDPNLAYINLRSVQKSYLAHKVKVQNEFKNFLNYFCETIFLIIEGYFQNPSFSENNSSSNGENESLEEIEVKCENTEKEIF